MLNPIDLIKPYLTYALLAFAAIGWAGYGFQTFHIRGMKLEAAQAEAKAQQAARAKEAEWSLLYKETTYAKENAMRTIAAERDAALLSLRNRPRNRLPETPASCAGASPAAISESDAGVAIRLAAEADELRSNYIACLSWAEAVTR